MDPVTGAAGLIVGLIRTHKLNEWARLCFGMAFSYAAAFSFTVSLPTFCRKLNPRCSGKPRLHRLPRRYLNASIRAHSKPWTLCLRPSSREPLDLRFPCHSGEKQ